jgi:glycosyltransferase involved in cell wall biosynthesis
MKIAIVAPCSVPYVVGGAEKLWWGLAWHFNEHTSHQAEIIKLPTPEQDLPALMRGYEAFAALDLGGFDAVISGKYPAWMVGHPRHICYMLHRLRGLYDSYPGALEVSPDLAAHKGVAALRGFMRLHRGSRAALAELFGRWNELIAGGAKPAGLLDFPGPLARELVHWLDEVALAPSAIARYAAISSTVAQRPGYFPEGVEVAVAYPPPHCALAPGERFDHFFTASRLDAPKRVELIVAAMRKVKTERALIVGGAGPEEARLRESAAGDPRIRFVGYQSDAEIRELYRNALAVPFVPYLEDYGLIAVEAMQAGKAVITTRDAGGPCELVEDGVNGIVCEATVTSLAAAMQRLADDPGLAASMGREGVRSASKITWAAVAETLLVPPRHRAPAAVQGPRRKLVVACTFPIYPPRHGGQSRVFNLYRSLAPEFDTVVVSVCPAAEPGFDAEIAPGLREVRIPMSSAHERGEHALGRKMGTPVTDVAMLRFHASTPALREALEREAQGASAVVACHPYLYPALKDLGVPVWYEAQDLEFTLKTALFGGRPGGQELIDAVQAVERECVQAAELILCASPDDAEELGRLYGAERGRVVLAPNGTDSTRIAFTSASERAALKAHLGVTDPLVFFMGSGHWPNINAVQRIFEFAAARTRMAFAVIGSVCYAFEKKLVPPNVMFLGEVDDITRNLCLQACDVAVNPVEDGSGTNLKMLDFFAAGVPVVTTERGSRGLRLDGETQCLVRPTGEFPAALDEVTGAGAEAAAQRAITARDLVEREFDWDAIGRHIKPRLIASADVK